MGVGQCTGVHGQSWERTETWTQHTVMTHFLSWKQSDASCVCGGGTDKDSLLDTSWHTTACISHLAEPQLAIRSTLSPDKSQYWMILQNWEKVWISLCSSLLLFFSQIPPTLFMCTAKINTVNAWREDWLKMCVVVIISKWLSRLMTAFISLCPLRFANRNNYKHF